MQLLAKFKKILYMGFRATLNFQATWDVYPLSSFGVMLLQQGHSNRQHLAFFCAFFFQWLRNKDSSYEV